MSLAISEAINKVKAIEQVTIYDILTFIDPKQLWFPDGRGTRRGTGRSETTLRVLITSMEYSTWIS